MRTLDPLPTGLAFGAVVGGWHLGWAALVAAGLAQPLLDFILKLHFIRVPVEVQPFDWATAGLLVGVTFGLGFLGGLALALVWNVLHRGVAQPMDKF